METGIESNGEVNVSLPPRLSVSRYLPAVSTAVRDLHVALNPGSHPAFRTASDEKPDESLGSRL